MKTVLVAYCNQNPLLLLRTHLPNDAKAAKKGGEQLSKKTLKSEGTAGLYCGFNISCVSIILYRGPYFGMLGFIASFALGWVITDGAGLASDPINTVCRRMMMTSGEAFKSKNSVDAFTQILKKWSMKFLFKGAGANILHAIAGAGVLAGYDKLQMIVFCLVGHNHVDYRW
ncbi:hypothetical protein V6N12_039357 [Hibiscus sabdariffa]|uniref:ADP/ATP translocase n=1 Tax=Hibiscus sabdariffa TaxID=183260 RepID=A0ABR2E0T1_9ROSI